MGLMKTAWEAQTKRITKEAYSTVRTIREMEGGGPSLECARTTLNEEACFNNASALKTPANL